MTYVFLICVNVIYDTFYWQAGVYVYEFCLVTLFIAEYFKNVTLNFIFASHLSFVKTM